MNPPRRSQQKESKAGLPLRLPFQRPKRVIGIFGQLRPDPPLLQGRDEPPLDRPCLRSGVQKRAFAGIPAFKHGAALLAFLA